MIGNLKKIDIFTNSIREEYNNKHITHIVNLEKDYNKIIVEFKYNPLTLEDKTKAKNIIINALGKYREKEELTREINRWEKYLDLSNLLTLSFDDENGFRGCTHRKNNNETIVVAEKESSPGIISGIVNRGEFKITVSIHALVTDICNYSLCVYGEER